MTLMLNGLASSFIIITLSEIAQNPIIDFATLFFITIPTPFLCFSPPEYIIVWFSCIIFPSSVQCVSAIPRISRFTFAFSVLGFRICQVDIKFLHSMFLFLDTRLWFSEKHFQKMISREGLNHFRHQLTYLPLKQEPLPCSCYLDPS